MPLLQLGVRFYNPATGVFTQRDPVLDGLNWYAYVGGGVMTAVDPSGLQVPDFPYTSHPGLGVPVIPVGAYPTCDGIGTIPPGLERIPQDYDPQLINRIAGSVGKWTMCMLKCLGVYSFAGAVFLLLRDGSWHSQNESLFDIVRKNATRCAREVVVFTRRGWWSLARMTLGVAAKRIIPVLLIGCAIGCGIVQRWPDIEIGLPF